MKNFKLTFAFLCMGLFFSFHQAEAQNCEVSLGSSRQTIRGFGGMNFPRWIPDLTSEQVDKAFGSGEGQLGLTILRVSVPPKESDWSREVPAAKRAKSHGAIIMGTPWSPPASMKTNGSTTGGKLKTSSYGAYAEHLKGFCDYMSSNDAGLYAISVQNEPDYVPNYESCGWTSSEMRSFLDNNASVIPVKVVGPETVNPKSSWYNDLSSSSELDIYADHLYGSGAKMFRKEHWMTEHYAPNSNSNSGNNWPEALDAAKEINECMANDYSAYIWWYIRRSYGLLDESGNVTKRGYVMSHFARFVRPGYKRINATFSPTSNVFVTAYKNNDEVVIVAINRGSSAKTINFDFSGDEATNFTKYETTSSKNVDNSGPISGGSSMSNTLAAYSINTFVGTFSADDDGDDGNSDGTNTIWLEAECGSLGSMWNVNPDGDASNGKYVTIKPGNNSTGSVPTKPSAHITYNFNITDGGYYNLYGRVITPTGDDDSFYMSMDGGTWFQWNNIGDNTSWTWETVQTYNLSKGNHTLTVAYREDGTQLDKLFIGNAMPSGEGEEASNCEDVPEYTLSTNVEGSGTLSGAGTYDEGTVVTLTAKPASGWIVDSWSGVDNSSGNTATVTMNSNKSVTVTFVESTVPTYTLTTNVIGAGSVSGGGTYAEGTSVTITATPESGHVFEGWSGDASGSSTSVSISMDSDKSVTATFVADDGDDYCPNPTTISLKFEHDGAGQFCWFTSDAISYVNSWNMKSVTINGVDYSNTWSNSMPPRVDGGYYITYDGEFPWSHFEASGTKSADQQGLSGREITVFPNPFDETIFVDLSGLDNISKLDVLNSLGQIILTKQVYEINSDVIPVQIENPGNMFIIQVYANDRVYTRSIIKK